MNTKRGRTSDELTLSLEARPVRTSPSPDSELAWVEIVASLPCDFWTSLAATLQPGSFGKMSPVFCPLTGDGLSAPSWEGWRNAGMGSPTGFWTLNIPVWPNDASVCSLSDVLEDAGSVPRRFFLTPRACAGIIRRAEKRGKELPPQLAQALKAVAMAEAIQRTDTSSKSRQACLPADEATDGQAKAEDKTA